MSMTTNGAVIAAAGIAARNIQRSLEEELDYAEEHEDDLFEEESPETFFGEEDRLFGCFLNSIVSIVSIALLASAIAVDYHLIAEHNASWWTWLNIVPCLGFVWLSVMMWVDFLKN